MNRAIKILLVALLCAVTVLSVAALAACDFGNTPEKPDEKCEHNMVYAEPVGNRHIIFCQNCHAKIREELHKYDPNFYDGLYCTECKYHECVFDQEIVSDKYFKEEANCEHGDVYYKSCKCGELNEYSTFEASLPKHELQHVSAVSSTCRKEGNIEYWYCKKCDDYFSNSDGAKEIEDKSSVVTPVADHLYTDELLRNTTLQKVCPWCGKIEGTEEIFRAFLNDDENSYQLRELASDAATVDLSEYKSYNGKPITRVGRPIDADASGTFDGCKNMTNIIIPDGITSIGFLAFGSCKKITSITIPASLTNIDLAAFNSCDNLETVYWNATSCDVLGDNYYYYSCVFAHCTNLKTVIVGDNVTRVSDRVFYDLAIENLTTPIGDFGYTSNFWIPTSALKTVVITGGDSIGAQAFYNCANLQSVSIPDTVTTIGNAAFSGCSSLASITIPDSVTTLGRHALSNCGSLTSVIIPNSVISIGEYAFYNCTNLESITIPFVGASIDGTDNTRFNYIFGGNVPASLKSVIITGGSSIGESAFGDCYSLESITILDRVTSIGESAFA